MAFCANCAKQISDQAAACPECGHPNALLATARQGSIPTGSTPGMAVASLVLGIVGIVTSFVFYFALLAGTLAMIFGFQAKKALEADPNLQGAGIAKAGRICGWVAIGLAILFWVFFLLIFTPIRRGGGYYCC